MIRIDINKLLFTIGYVVILIKIFIDSSTIQAIPFFELIKNNYTAPATIILIILSLFKINYIRNISLKNLIGVILVFSSLLLSIYFSQSSSLRYLMFLIFLAFHIELRYIVKTFLIIKLPIVVLLISLSLSGVIENFEFIDKNRGARYAFGAIYATDFAASIFYLQMAYYYLRKNINILEVLVSSVITYLVYIYTGARVSVILMTLAIIIFYLAGTRFSWIVKSIFKNKIMSFIFVIGFAISTILSYTYSYTDKTMILLDEFLSGRLRLGNLAFNNYDIKLFGQKIILQGNGWTQHEWDSSIGYNFIDASYLQWLFIYGIAVTVILLVLLVLVYKKGVEVNNLPLIMILSLIAISGVIDHHLLNLGMNPFIFALAIIIFNRDKDDKLWA